MNRKQLVKERCSNFKDGLCLLRDIECPLVTAFKYRNHEFPCEEATCDYFDKNVIGYNTSVEDTMYSYKPCNKCGNRFKPAASANKYCSNACRTAARNKSHRKYNVKRNKTTV